MDSFINLIIIATVTVICSLMWYAIGVETGATMVTEGKMICEQKNSYRNPPVWVGKEK